MTQPYCMYFCRGWLSLDPLPFSDTAEYNGNSKKILMLYHDLLLVFFFRFNCVMIVECKIVL